MPWRDVITEEESPEYALCLALDNQAFMFRSVDALVAKTQRPAEFIREFVTAHPDLVRRSNGERETYGLIERIGHLEPAPVAAHYDMPAVDDNLGEPEDEPDEGDGEL